MLDNEWWNYERSFLEILLRKEYMRWNKIDEIYATQVRTLHSQENKKEHLSGTLNFDDFAKKIVTLKY